MKFGDDKENLLQSTEYPLKKFKTISVEGNVGCGKTTLLDYFSNVTDIEICYEPVEKWKDMDGHNFLELMYNDAKQWSSVFQSYVQLTMLELQTRETTKPLKLIERSLSSAKYCFVENMYQTGLMEKLDYAILDEWFQFIECSHSINIDLIVYLRSSPSKCFERMKNRNRPEECLIPITYLEQLHELHDKWLLQEKSIPVKIVDANRDIECMEETYDILIKDFRNL